MKRLFVVSIAFIFLTGCAYHKITQVEVTGKDVSVPIGGLLSVHGEGIKAKITRQVSWSWGREIKEISVISGDFTTE